MNPKPIAAVSAVEGDLRLALSHYDSWHPVGRGHFLKLYQATVLGMARFPDGYPKVLGGIQRALVLRSFFLVYFIQEADRILILAVLDGRMSPSSISRLLGVRKQYS